MTAALATPAVLATGASASTTRYDISFDRVLDAVDDLGMDDTGSEPIDEALDSAYRDGTLIQFPPGQYRIEDYLTGRGVSNFGIEGLGDAPRDVQFVAAGSFTSDRIPWLNIRSGGAHLLKNVAVQNGDDEQTGATVIVQTDGGALIEDVEWLGVFPDDDDALGQILNVTVLDQDGVSVVRRVTMGVDAAAVRPGYPNGAQGIRSSASHEGELRIEDVHLERLGSSAVRVNGCPGVLTLRGGFFKNNDNANVRFGAGDHPSKVSTAKGFTVVIDDPDNQTGDALRFDSSPDVHAGAVAEDFDIDWATGTGHRAVISVPDFATTHGSVTLRNARVRNNADHPVVLAEPSSASDDAITVENLSITGDGVNSQGAICIKGRDGSTVQNCCIQQPGSGQDGVHISDSDDCAVADSNINVDGDATVFENSTVETSGITYSDTCPLPGSDGSSDDGSSGDGSSDDSPSELSNELRIQGTGVETQYSFEVSGELEPDSSTIESHDEVTSTGATAWVTTTEHVDVFAFSGEVSSFEYLQGEADVYVNGELVDPTAPDLPNKLVLDGAASDGQTDYSFAVSGDLATAPDLGAVESDDVVSGGSVEGAVADDVDGFRFSGDLTALSVNGNASVTFEDNDG